jgi:hypothetical protein
MGLLQTVGRRCRGCNRFKCQSRNWGGRDGRDTDTSSRSAFGLWGRPGALCAWPCRTGRDRGGHGRPSRYRVYRGVGTGSGSYQWDLRLIPVMILFGTQKHAPHTQTRRLGKHGAHIRTGGMKKILHFSTGGRFQQSRPILGRNMRFFLQGGETKVRIKQGVSQSTQPFEGRQAVLGIEPIRISGEKAIAHTGMECIERERHKERSILQHMCGVLHQVFQVQLTTGQGHKQPLLGHIIQRQHRKMTETTPIQIMGSQSYQLYGRYLVQSKRTTLTHR